MVQYFWMSHQVNRRFKAIDLFSGCGGLTHGLRRASFRVIGAVEIDGLAVETYRMNHSGVQLWAQDIRSLSALDVRSVLGLKVGDLDLLTGCPPCQGFSVLRTRNGHHKVVDLRNDLVYDFLRFVRELRPKTVMMENVPALAGDQRMADLRSTLTSLGYTVTDGVLNAADFGVPQRRRRLIVLASRFGRVSFPSASTRRRTVRGAIGLLPAPGESGDPLHDLPERRSDRVATIIRQIPTDGGSRSELPGAYQLECHRRSDGFKDTYGRMAWRKVAPTITSGCFNPSKGRFLHPEAHRGITMREAALLQSFPRRYRFSARRGKSRIALLIGNAVPPTFAYRQALEIRQHLLAAGEQP